jgi:hypothetical protein
MKKIITLYTALMLVVCVNAQQFTLNASVTTIVNITGLNGQLRNPSVEVINLGLNNITSFDVDFDYNGIIITENISAVNMIANDVYQVDFVNSISLIGGTNTGTATVYNVNGLGQDDNPNDDIITTQITAVTPAPGKLVIGEEVTGTWCAYCPLGAVALNWMDHYYEDYWQGIAIHNGDPMVDPPYDNGMAPFIVGYPSGVIDRGLAVIPAAFGTLEQDFLQRVVIPPTGIITNGAELNGNILTVSLTVDFQIAVSGNYKLACIIVEDSVTGTSPSYSQANAYSTGLQGPIIDVDGTDWANLPPLVPASQMVYRHVGRRIAPSFTGEPLSSTSYNAGDNEAICFDFTLAPTWDQSQISIMGMLIDHNNRVDNGSSSSLIDAIDVGLDTSCIFSIYTFPSWDCINGMTCIDPGTGQGQYPNQSACMTNCLFAPDSWNCDISTGICSDPGTGNGQYTTLAACQSACTVTPSWDCDPSTGSCFDPGTGLGQYPTQIDCILDSCGNTPNPSWDCVEGACVDPGTGIGIYSSLTACNQACGVSAIEEHITTKELLKITDILGREIKETKNKLLFYIYDDGTVEKKIILE